MTKKKTKTIGYIDLCAMMPPRKTRAHPHGRGRVRRGAKEEPASKHRRKAHIGEDVRDARKREATDAPSTRGAIPLLKGRRCTHTTPSNRAGGRHRANAQERRRRSTRSVRRNRNARGCACGKGGKLPTRRHSSTKEGERQSRKKKVQRGAHVSERRR